MPDARANIRVSTLELFFDLVFVFTITQLAESLGDHLDLPTLGNVLLILAVVWWMYSGYAWLTNAVAPTSTTRRTLLLTGMAGFLVMALAIPEAFGSSGWIFGIGYLAVTLVHSAMFLTLGRGAVEAMRVVAPLNVLAALLVLGGGLVPEPWRHVLWIAAPLVQISAGYLRKLDMHSPAVAHFTERHGLVVIIAIGESIVAIGLGFRDLHLDHGAILVAVLGMCIAYYLYWFYFAGEDARAEQVLAGIDDPLRRGRTALEAWGFGHYPILLGVVIAAVGIKKTVGHAYEGLHWGPAVALGGGVALYLLGHAAFLARLGLRGALYRVTAAALVLATIPLGHLVAIAQLVAIVAVMVATAITEYLPEIRRSGPTAVGDFGRTAS